MENKIKVELSLKEVEDITHQYLMSWCEWSDDSEKEFAKGNKTKAEAFERISQDQKKAFDKFKAIRNKMKEGK